MGIKKKSKRIIFIKEIKDAIAEDLIENYKLTEVQARKAIRKSYLSEFMKDDPHFVDHESIEDLAKDIYREFTGDLDPHWIHQNLLEM